MSFSFISIDLVSMFAHAHPALVHLPIGILFFSFVISLLPAEKRDNYQYIWKLSLLLAAITSLLSCIAGYLLSQSGDYDLSLVSKHQWLGISTCILSIASYIFSAYRRMLVWITAAVMMVAGHLGGVLTHGEGYLWGETETTSKSAPLIDTTSSSKTKDTSVAVNNISTQVFVYRDQIAPILKNKCYSCHSSIKMKGGLRLDAEAFIRKGGKHGLILHEGNPSNSKLYANLILPEEDDHHMPPKGKKQPTQQEINMIHRWIGEGAPFGAIEGSSAPVQPNPSVLSVKEEKVTVEKVTDEPLVHVSEKLSNIDKEVIDKIQQKGIVVTLASDGSNELVVNFVNLKEPDASVWNLLQSVSKNIVELKMTGQKATPSMLSLIRTSQHLKLLHIAKTGINDDAIHDIVLHPQLQSLNLYGNAITDRSLDELAACKQLQQLYVWQTKVSADGIRRLQSALPALKIDAGSFTFVKPDSAKK